MYLEIDVWFYFTSLNLKPNILFGNILRKIKKKKNIFKNNFLKP